MADEPIIQTRQLSKQYGEQRVLDQLDLTVPRHAIFGFLGPNGAGKTTTMKLLLNLIKPSSGSAAIFGLDSVEDGLAVRSRVGYLPQQPRFYEEMSARETLHFVAGFFFRGPQAAIDRRVDELLVLVGLADKGDRPVRGFSGGERQRLGIAQAQINDPDLLILDEPAAALDPIGRRDVLQILSRLRERTTIFYSTHILDDVQQVSDTVAILHRGRLVSQGSITTLLNGNSRTLFDVALRGSGDAARGLVARQPWVDDVVLAHGNGAVTLQVAVNDERQAEEQLFRLLAGEPDLTILRYGRRTFELEDVFMELVEGATDER